MNAPLSAPLLPLRSVRLTNFRGFAEQTVALDERVTVLFGSNAAGKTTLLDALAIGVSPIVSRARGVRGRRLVHATDLRRAASPQGRFDDLDRVDLVDEPSCRLEMTNASGLAWSQAIYRSAADRSLDRRDIGVRALNVTLDPQIRAVLDEAIPELGPVLPMVAYYGNARAVVDVPLRDRVSAPKDAAHTRLKAWDGALSATTQFRAAFEWFRTMEEEERRGKIKHRSFDYTLPALDWVRLAIERACPRLRHPRIDTRPIRMTVDFEHADGNWHPMNLRSLSDGFRTHFALVVDIARRMVQLNPCADLQNTERAIFSPALILIDEVDLHLDPVWQTSVVPDLAAAFPNAQFVVTTHSEQVIGSVLAQQVRHLRWEGDKLQCEPVPFAQGASGERILIELMGAPERVPGVVTQNLDRYLKLVQHRAGRQSEALELRTELDRQLGADERLHQADLELLRQDIMDEIAEGAE
jgi:predicted ATP-binding protein involved in virulence